MTMTIRVVDGPAVRRLVDMGSAIPAVRAAMEALSKGWLDQPDRQGFSAETLVMSAHDRSTGSTVVKLWSGRPKNRASSRGTVVWDDPRGRIVADAGAITAIRTGAIVGVATDRLAPTSARRLAMLGTGHLALDQVLAVRTVRPIDHVAVWSRRFTQAISFADALRDTAPELVVVAVQTVEEALQEADVVCCATPSVRSLFGFEHLKEEVHVNAVGSFQEHMHELPQALLQNADLIVVDHVSACLNESGEIIEAVRSGVVDIADLTEIGTMTTNSAGGRTVFKSVGVAAQDWAIGRLLADALFASPLDHAG